MALTIDINADRLWQTLMRIAEIGATENGGSNRLALTDADAEARRLLSRWCEECGCSVSVDSFGNMFARRDGRRSDLEPIAFGSHLDTQPRGGRFDGVLGVLAGLEILRALEQNNIETERPLLLINWTNEEGSRFAPAMMGSSVYAHHLDQAEALALTDRHGQDVADALESTGFVGPVSVGEPSFARFFELHIEQGPILEQKGLDIGVVTGAQAASSYDVRLVGQSMHAGTTPVKDRRDALVVAARLIDAMSRYASKDDPRAMATIGELIIHGASRNVVPGEVDFTVDLRHETDTKLAQLESIFVDRLQCIAGAARVAKQYERVWQSSAVLFDTKNIESVAQAADKRGYCYEYIASGAGHDAVRIAPIQPTSMIFIPCLHGISHNEAEYASPEQCTKGAQILCDVVLEHAGSSM